MMMVAYLFAIFAAFAAASTDISNAPQPLTVSGVSAGAAFAVQYQIAHSAKVRAAGIIAGLPYYCATVNGIPGAYGCMDDPMLISIVELDNFIALFAAEGFIDHPSHLKSHAVMLFSGLIDSVVSHLSMELLQNQYQALGVQKIVSYFNYTAQHAWITNFAGNGCATLGTPYINNCGLDFAGNFLRMAFKQMGLPFVDKRGVFNAANLLQFSQAAYGANPLTNSLDTIGFYYVPSACLQNTSCPVHVNFHGCTQGRSSLGTTYVTYTGLNEWAETNNIIVLYPQATANPLLGNPNGCFDWWGYAGPNYTTKAGTQMMIVESMISTLQSTGKL